VLQSLGNIDFYCMGKNPMKGNGLQAFFKSVLEELEGKRMMNYPFNAIWV